eukprot:scaffold8313_cov77-Skeletonema_dohrnii-CCMP3373.AAC.2
MSGGTSEQRIPLSEWIRTFLDQQQFGNISNHTAASSSDYLILALRLTCSLADEICRVGEETGRLPTPRFDWMDSIVVHLKSNSSKEDGTENVVNTILTDDDDDDIRVELLPSLLESPYPPLRIGPTASKSLREWGGTQKRRKIKNFKLANVEVNCEIAGRPL